MFISLAEDFFPFRTVAAISTSVRAQTSYLFFNPLNLSWCAFPFLLFNQCVPSSGSQFKQGCMLKCLYKLVHCFSATVLDSHSVFPLSQISPHPVNDDLPKTCREKGNLFKQQVSKCRIIFLSNLVLRLFSRPQDIDGLAYLNWY